MLTAKQFKALIYDTATGAGVPDVVARCMVAQAQHETGNFTSPVLKANNNLFGMRMPSKRPKTYILSAGTAPGKSEGPTPYAKYASYENSVLDLLAWHKYNKIDLTKIHTPEQYDAAISAKGYHAQGQAIYTAALVRYFRQLEGKVLNNPGASLAAILGLVALAWYINRG